MKFGRITGRITLLAAAVIAMLLGACRDGGLIDPPNPTDSCCAKMVVSVTHSRTTAPLGGVEVLLRQQGQVVQRGETGPDGRVVFSNVCHGVFDLRLAKTGYQVAERGQIAVQSCDTVRAAFAMLMSDVNTDSCCNSSVLVVPTTPDGQSVAGAAIRLTAPDGTVKQGSSTPQGTLFGKLCPGRYALRIQAENFKVDESIVEVGCNHELVVRRALPHATEPPDSCCHGKVFVGPKDGATGELLNGAIVRLWQGGRILQTVTVNGRPAGFDGLCAGAYAISITREGYRTVEFELRIECNGTFERAVPMERLQPPPPDSCCRNTASFTLIDGATRRPVAGAAVLLVRPNMPNPTPLRSDANGVVIFREICAGTHTLVVEREGFGRIEKTVTIVCGQELRQTIEMRATTPPPPDTCCNASIRLTVKGPVNGQDGVPLMGVTVTIAKGGRVIADGITNREGVFVKEGLCGNSTYVISFTKDGYVRKTIEFAIRDCRLYTETINLTR